MEEKQGITDFVMLPRKLRDDYLEGKINKNQFDVVLWIWISANPYNGYFPLSYKGLVQDFRGNITEINARKIISSLCRKQYIYFSHHKGRKGSFPVYPAGFRLTSGKIQTWEELKDNKQITASDTTERLSNAEPNHNLDRVNHNLEEMKKQLLKSFSMDRSVKRITTLYNDNDIKNNKNIGSDFLNKNISDNRLAYKKEIPVNSFFPKSSEQERCWDIAKELGEIDMRFLLSCLNKYGIQTIERAWADFQKIAQHQIQDKPKYFNKLIRNLAEKESS